MRIELMTPIQGVVGYLTKTLALAEMEIRKLKHDPTELVTRVVQPILWLLVFGEVLSKVRAIPTGGLTYLEFLTPGILAQSVLFVAIFYGIAVIWERDLGIVHKFLASPAPRSALVLGKALSAGIRGLSQALIIYLLAILLGVHVRLGVPEIVGVLVLVMIGAGVFSTLSLIIACVVKTRERFMGIGQLLTMPLFFASNALYPISLMPSWLQAIAGANPLTYLVDALRILMLHGYSAEFSLVIDFGALILTMAVLVLIGARLYPRLAR
jgi:ABC-2 type transport system permease protein